MEPEAPWAVDQAIKSRSGSGAPTGIGTVTGDNAQVIENASYLALDAYKFDLPNTENFLPASTCPTCTPTAVNATNTWSPKALAELVEGIGGAVVATHSQAGSIGHHMARVGGISVWELATLCVFAGFAFAAVVAARVQHDIMGGGWDGGFSLPIISYISPQVALYVISPSGISAAARRLNSSPARLILVEYGLAVTAFLVVLHRLVGR